MANSTDPRVHAATAALAAPESPLRRGGIGLVVDFALGRPLRSFVEPEALESILRESLQVRRLSEEVSARAPAAWKRQLRRSEESGEAVGALLPDSVRTRLRATLASTPPPAARWADGAVDPRLLRKLIAPVFPNVLLSFARRLPIPGSVAGGGGASLVGALGDSFRRRIEKSAGQALEAGKAVLGGFGVDLEKEVERAASEFSDTAEAEFREALMKRIETPEGRELVGEIQAQILDRFLETRLGALRDDVEGIPWPEFVAALPDVFEHLRIQPLFAKALHEEIAAWLDLDGHRPLGELLSEAGILEAVRAAAIERGDALAREFVEGEACARWLGDLFAATDPVS